MAPLEKKSEALTVKYHIFHPLASHAYLATHCREPRISVMKFLMRPLADCLRVGWRGGSRVIDVSQALRYRRRFLCFRIKISMVTIKILLQLQQDN